MKPKTLILLLVAVSCGLVAMLLVSKLGAKNDSPTDEFLVAVTDMNPGDKITNLDTQFKDQKFIPGTAPPKSMQRTDIVAKPDKLLGRVLVRPLGRGEAVTERHLKDDSIADKLKPGERAMSVPVKMDTVVSGFTLPGNHVDLICTYSEGQRSITKTFLQDVPVLAVNIETTRPETSSAIITPTTVTLAVKAKDAQKIAWAMKQTQYITLTLRNLADKTLVQSGITTDLETKNSEKSSEDGADADMKTVLRAKSNIAVNAPINKANAAELFEVVKIQKDLCPPDTIASLDDPVFDEKDLTAKVDLLKLEFATRRFLGKKPDDTQKPEGRSDAFEQILLVGDRLTINKWEKRGNRWVVVATESGTPGAGSPSDAPPSAPPSAPPMTPPGGSSGK